MLLTELQARIDAILTEARTGDDELAHAMEDRLLGELATGYAAAVVLAQIDRMFEGDWATWFVEWYVLRNRD